MRMWGLTSLFVLLLASGSCFGDDQDQDRLRSRLLNEGPKGWKQLAQLSDRIDLSGTMRFESRNLGSDAPNFSESWRYMSHGRLKKGVRHRDRSGNETDNGFVIGAKYNFAVAKDGQQAWRATYIGPKRSQIDKMLTNTVQRFVMAPYALDGEPLVALFDNPDFKVKDVELLDRSGKELVSFSFEQRSSPERKIKVEGGRVIVDPSMLWAVQEVDLDIDKSNVHISVSYGPSDSGRPVLQSVSNLATTKKPREQELSFVFDSYKYADVPESEFTLASFDIDAKARLTGTAPPSQLDTTISAARKAGIAVSALVFLVTAFMLYRRHQLRAQSA